ncbi:MAG: MBL fold metallo-hydrolase [Deltaproteobacteria bacterium]|nr:MBL fold metallo-hydrolase [Deltaproteobacteria bacterium]
MKRVFPVVVLLVLCVLSGSLAQALEATKLADRVYGIKGPKEAFNTAFVVGDRGVFVFGCDLPTYDERLQVIRSVAGNKAIRFVGNGHYAFDDSGCNHLFAEQGAIIVGNPEFARLLLPYWPKEVASRLKQGRVKKEYAEGKKVEMAMPTVLFNDKLTLDLGSHVVELHFVGKAHTTDNTVVWLPKEKILFTDDLVFTELHATADDRSDTVNWQRILRNLASWSPNTVVPGHGVFAAGNGAKPLVEQDRYFDTMRAKVKAMKEAGKSLEEVKKGVRAELGEFAKWPRERAIPGTAEQFYRELSAQK